MTRLLARSPARLLGFGAAFLLTVTTGACLPERGGVPDKAAVAAASKDAPGAKADGRVDNKAIHPAPRAQPEVAAAGSASGCNGAALTLPKGTVVARIDGKDITVDDLGGDLERAEKQALRTYCQEVTNARQSVLDNFMQQRLLTAAAEAEGKDINSFVQGKVDAEVPTPDDAAIAEFYESNKSPTAPALELVRDQVIQAMKGEGSEKVLAKLIDDLRAKARVERMLPDVSPPPMDLSNPPHAPFAGPEDALVKVVEFSDFECPYCSRAADTMRGLKERYAGKPVQFVYRHFPLSFHPNARPAAEYAQCAQQQGKFWELHDGIFARQSELSADMLKDVAAKAGLDTAKLESCLAAGAVGLEVEEDMRKAQEVGVQGTPSFFINGQTYGGNPTVDGIAQVIDAELARLQG